jgi:hypothetical protein
MKKQNKAEELLKALPAQNALAIDYGRLQVEDVMNSDIREPFNRAFATMGGIRTISKILYADEQEQNAQDGAQSLPYEMRDDLFSALLVLADYGWRDLNDLANELHPKAKGGVA